MPALVGRNAEVTVAIPKGGVGQVTLSYGGERSEHIGAPKTARPSRAVGLSSYGASEAATIVVARAESAVKGGLQ